jgi:hypothetical protein
MIYQSTRWRNTHSAMPTLHDKAVTYLSKHVEEILKLQNKNGATPVM